MSEKMMPSNDNLLIIKELDYVCPTCKSIISGYEIKFEKMPNNFIVVGLSAGSEIPNNFIVAGLSAGSEIPKCPLCGDLAFFGMREAKGSEL